MNDTAAADDEWIGISEASRLLGLSVATLRRYDESGRLRASRSPSGQRRYKRRDIRAAISHTTDAAASA